MAEPRSRHHRETRYRDGCCREGARDGPARGLSAAGADTAPPVGRVRRGEARPDSLRGRRRNLSGADGRAPRSLDIIANKFLRLPTVNSKVVQSTGDLHHKIVILFLRISENIFDNATAFNPSNDMLNHNPDT